MSSRKRKHSEFELLVNNVIEHLPQPKKVYIWKYEDESYDRVYHVHLIRADDMLEAYKIFRKYFVEKYLPGHHWGSVNAISDSPPSHIRADSKEYFIRPYPMITSVLTEFVPNETMDVQRVI